MAQQVTDRAVQKRVPLAKYIKAEVQSRLKPVESKVCPMLLDRPLSRRAGSVELQKGPCVTAATVWLIDVIHGCSALTRKILCRKSKSCSAIRKMIRWQLSQDLRSQS